MRARGLKLPGLTLVLGLLAAVASWTGTEATWVPRPGLDPSFQAAAYFSAERGLQFGHQIVLTYGPLAFLNAPALWDPGLALLAFGFVALLRLALGITLVWALRRWMSGIVATVVAVAVLLAASSVDVPIALATVWCLIALAPSPPPAASWLVSIGGALLGAVETLAQVREGPLILLIGAITLAAVRPRRLPIFAGLAAVAVLGLWLAAGQSIGALPDYVSTSAQIASGYSQAMVSTAPTGIALPGALAIAVLLTAAAAAGSAPGRARVAGGVVAGLSAFAVFKEAFVRSDYVHQPIFFATVLALAAGLAFGRRRLVAVATLGALVVVSLLAASPPDLAGTLNPVTRIEHAAQETNLVFSPARRALLERVGHEFLIADYRLDPGTLGLLRGHTVSVDPWEAAAAFTYRLHWQPVPVFQNYDAYTPRFDHLNAAALASAGGPQRILRENTAVVDPLHATSVDMRFPSWDPPAQAIAMFCHYVPVRATGRWQTLTKVADRCSRAAFMSAVSSAYGRVVNVPQAPPGSLVETFVHGAGVHGLEQLRSLLYRAHIRYATVNTTRRYRLIAATAADGLLMNVAPGLDYPAPFALSPQARTLQITGESGPLRFAFYSVRVRKPS